MGYLLCSIVSGIIVEKIKRSYPEYLAHLKFFSTAIARNLDLRISPEIIAFFLVALLLAFIWGIGFKLLHSD